MNQMVIKQSGIWLRGGVELWHDGSWNHRWLRRDCVKKGLQGNEVNYKIWSWSLNLSKNISMFQESVLKMR